VSEADGTFPIGLSRVWKIPADANNVVCSEDSGPCEVLIDGLTSVIDVAIGPDGLLYVVEFDENSWFASFIPGFWGLPAVQSAPTTWKEICRSGSIRPVVSKCNYF
jgi:hypothetical protein